MLLDQPELVPQIDAGQTGDPRTSVNSSIVKKGAQRGTNHTHGNQVVGPEMQPYSRRSCSAENDASGIALARSVPVMLKGTSPAASRTSAYRVIEALRVKGGPALQDGIGHAAKSLGPELCSGMIRERLRLAVLADQLPVPDLAALVASEKQTGGLAECLLQMHAADL